MKALLLMLAAIAVSSRVAASSIEPLAMTCKSELKSKILHNDGTAESGSDKIEFNLDSVTSIEFSEDSRIAKFFPANGLDGILFSSKLWRIESDERTYWNLIRLSSVHQTKVQCRVGL